MKRIIIEGCDGTGKTTLIKQIMEAIPGLHRAPSFKTAMDNGIPYSEWITDQLDGHEEPLIHDRLFYSELVYSRILRPEVSPSMLPDQQRAVNARLMSEALLIYCNIPYEHLVKTATHEEQLEGVMENLYKIYHSYEMVIGDVYARYAMKHRYVYYDFTKMDPRYVINIVRGYIG